MTDCVISVCILFTHVQTLCTGDRVEKLSVISACSLLTQFNLCQFVLKIETAFYCTSLPSFNSCSEQAVFHSSLQCKLISVIKTQVNMSFSKKDDMMHANSPKFYEGSYPIPSTPSPTVALSNTTPSSNKMMSSSLKERLKKCGRYHPATPPSVKAFTLGQVDVARQTMPRRILLENLNRTNVIQESGNPGSEDFLATTAHDASAEIPKKECLFLKKSQSEETNFSQDQIVTSLDRDLVNPSSEVFDLISHTLGQLSSNSESRFHLSPNQTTLEVSESYDDLATKKRSLNAKLTERKEMLRKLNMVKTYRSKNNLKQLQELIEKWHCACQQAILDLHHLLPNPRPSLGELVTQLSLDKDFIKFNVEEESFDTTA